MKYDLYLNIKKIRSYKGLSQQNLADELSITQRHIGRIENGDVDISITLLYKIAKALDVKVQLLLGLEEMQVFNNFNQNQQTGHFVANNQTDVEKITQLYERLLAEKETVIKHLQAIPVKKK